MHNFHIVFVHGYTASHTADWFPAIAKKLQKEQIDFSIPDLAGGEYPKATEWLDVLDKTIELVTKPLVLVGHSLGTRAILLYLEKYKPQVREVILVAAFKNDLIEVVRPIRKTEYGNFFLHKVELGKIKPLVGHWTILHSKDDPDIGYDQAVALSADLDAELLSYENRTILVSLKMLKLYLMF